MATQRVLDVICGKFNLGEVILVSGEYTDMLMNGSLKP
jgi:hypothetical protein